MSQIQLSLKPPFKINDIIMVDTTKRGIAYFSKPVCFIGTLVDILDANKQIPDDILLKYYGDKLTRSHNLLLSLKKSCSTRLVFKKLEETEDYYIIVPYKLQYYTFERKETL